MRNTHVVNALSPLKADKWVIIFSSMSWVASSASAKVPSIRRDKLNTMSCTPATSTSRASLSPAVAFSAIVCNSSLVF